MKAIRKQQIASLLYGKDGAPDRSDLEPILDELKRWNSVLSHTSLGNPQAVQKPEPANDQVTERTKRRRVQQASRYMGEDK